MLEQFLNTTVEDKAKLTEAYLVGNRLVKFVSRVLPTHSNYFSNDTKLMAMRSQSQAQLVQLLQYLEELALIIDEEEYQDFIRENQELNALSGDEEEEPSFEDAFSDEVSSLDEDEEPSMSFGEGPSFAASDVAQTGLDESQNMQDFPQSRIRAKQNEESQSWDQAFSDQIAPQLPELEKHQQESKQEEGDLFGNAKFEVEWAFPTDFAPSEKQSPQPDVGKIDTYSSSRSSLPPDFVDSNAWPSSATQNAADQGTSMDGWIPQHQRQGPDSSSFASSPELQTNNKPIEKMTLRPRALYGDSSNSEREQSPKSVYELPEFLPETKSTADADDESYSHPPAFNSRSVEGYLSRVDVERPPPSDDDGVSMLSGEEEDASLTGSSRTPRRRRMGHFKGCVRCLLD